MRKLTCYACSWCIFLAGTVAVLLGEESALPPPPLPGATAATVSTPVPAPSPALAPAPMPPSAAGTVSAPGQSCLDSPPGRHVVGRACRTDHCGGFAHALPRGRLPPALPASSRGQLLRCPPDGRLCGAQSLHPGT